MANFASRNVLICVVPAVVILLSVYWFRKKKKMKVDATSPINQSTLPASKTNDAHDNHGGIYSSVESTYDYSNTLSDASSISSPENSARTPSVSCETPIEDTRNNLCVKQPFSVSNHTEHLNYQDIISVSKEEKSVNSHPQILNIHKSENKSNSVSFTNEIKEPSVDYKNTADNDEMQLKIEEKISNSLPKLEGFLEIYTCENGQISKPANHSSDFSNGYNDSSDSGTLFELQDQKPNSDVSESSSIDNIVEEPVVTKIQSNFTTSMLNDRIDASMKEPNKVNETDSNSSVLDENSLSSISDESERHIDFKYKDSPSSVFDGNSIGDESEKTDISNEEHAAINLKPEENCKDDVESLSNEVESSLCVVPNNEQYSVQLNKNSFFTKTILSEGVANEISSSISSCVESVTNSSTSSQFGDSVLPDSLQTSSEEPCSPIDKDDSGALVENNNQHVQQNEIDSSKDVSSLKSFLTNEIDASNSEVISCTTFHEACNQQDGQSETAVNQSSSDIPVSSLTDDVTVSKPTLEVSSSNQLDSVSCVQNESTTDTANLKAQEDQLEPLSQDKVNDLEGDVKSSAVIPGLFVYEFDLPQELCGRLIGKQGKHVKSIKERTNANVFIKRHPFDTNLKTVVVEGSRNAVHSALDIIRRKFPPSQFPSVSLVQTNIMNSHGVPLPESLQLHLPEGASCDVILSSLVSAGHFFLQQPTHPTYPSLSTLDQCMITCYAQMETPLLPHPVEAGVICAAPVINGWFRAQVIYVYENRNECEVKFVDYGGFSQLPTSALRQIRSDFMTLPLQASECYLANVRPVDRNAGWSSEATSVFEELAQGQILQALLVEYADDGIPCVHLYRVQGVSNMFINRELVERGLAVWVDNNRWDPH